MRGSYHQRQRDGRLVTLSRSSSFGQAFVRQFVQLLHIHCRHSGIIFCSSIAAVGSASSQAVSCRRRFKHIHLFRPRSVLVRCSLSLPGGDRRLGTTYTVLWLQCLWSSRWVRMPWIAVPAEFWPFPDDPHGTRSLSGFTLAASAAKSWFCSASYMPHGLFVSSLLVRRGIVDRCALCRTRTRSSSNGDFCHE